MINFITFSETREVYDPLGPYNLRNEKRTAGCLRLSDPVQKPLIHLNFYLQSKRSVIIYYNKSVHADVVKWLGHARKQSVTR